MAIENAKTLNVRIRNKYDSYENWAASSLVLEAGEIAIAYTSVDVKVDNGTAKHPALLMKVGDGEKTFANLPWLSAKAADVLSVCKNETDLKAFVNGVIADAGIASSSAMEALSGKVTAAEGEIDALQADLNTAETGLKARVTTAEAAIDALELLVGDTNVNAQIKAYVDGLNLSTTYEAKGEAAKVSASLEAYKTSTDAKILEHTNAITGTHNAIVAIKDGETIDSFKDVETALAGKETSGAAVQALADAKSYADGLAGNYDVKGAAATAESNAKAYAKEYADGLAGNYDAAGSASAAESAAKGYTDSELTRLVGDKSVSEQIDALDLDNTYAAKSHKHTKADITDFTHTHEISEVDGLEAALEGKEAAGAAAAALAEAKTYADGKDEDIAAAKKAGDDAQDDVDALEAYVGTIPEGYTESSVIAYINKKAEETLASASGNSTETAASVKAALDTYKTENNAKVNANTEAIEALETQVGDGTVSEQIAAVTNPLSERVATIEGDYLKAADKTELEGKIQTNANAIERLTNGVSAEEVDGVNDLIQYVKDHGTEVTGMKADIKSNSDAIDAIEADYLKAADKAELAGDISDLEGRMGSAETAIGTKAAQADLTALADRVTTIETEHDAESTGLKARMTAAEADIDALETKVGDKTVSEQITAVTNPLAERVVALEAVDHSHANAAELDKIADGDKAKWDAKLEDVTAAADSGLKATKTGNTVAIEIDDSITFVFDCGNASV